MTTSVELLSLSDIAIRYAMGEDVLTLLSHM